MRAVAAARCVLLKSGKNENPDGESDGDEDDDERTEIGKIMERSVIGKLGNKPPTNAYVKINK